MMRIAMIARSTLYSIYGGDTVQVLQTAKELTALGVTVDIKLTNEMIEYGRYDLLHFFNIIRPADILAHIKRSNVPFVVSTITVDYSEYEKEHRKGISGMIFRYLSPDNIEYAKTTARWLLGRDKLMSIDYLWNGQYKSIRKIIQRSAMLLPNSFLEYERLMKRYNCKPAYKIVPNGIDEELFSFDPTVEKDQLLVICVARIEGLKNQYNLIKALNGTKYKLLLIGSATPNQPGYYLACKKNSAENISFVDAMPQDQLKKHYSRAKVHVLASWFETTGLSSLEAAAMGCNVVITAKGDAKEYFSDDAFYCDPALPESIFNAVEKAASAPLNEALQKRIRSQFTWKQAAVATLSAYHQIIGHS